MFGGEIGPIYLILTLIFIVLVILIPVNIHRIQVYTRKNHEELEKLNKTIERELGELNEMMESKMVHSSSLDKWLNNMKIRYEKQAKRKIK